jgi:hypothetical protein
VILKDQAKISYPGIQIQDVRLRNDIEFQPLSLIIDQDQIANERRATEIGFEAGFNRRKTFRQLYEELAYSGFLEDQEARPPVAEWYLADIDPVSEKVEVG